MFDSIFLANSEIFAYNMFGKGRCLVTLGQLIKNCRLGRGLTQAELAAMLNKGESTVRTWELDRASPDRKAIYKLCEIFDVTPDYFYYNSPPPDSMADGLKRSFEIKNQLAKMIGKWTPYQASKRLPLLDACQDLTDDELTELLNYIKYLQSKREGGEEDK